MAARQGARRGHGLGGRTVGGARQVDDDGGALAERALDVDMAPRLGDEAVHHAQPQARALADLLGGEERVEDARQRLGRYPRTLSR